jgi:hypothetical protein
MNRMRKNQVVGVSDSYVERHYSDRTAPPTFGLWEILNLSSGNFARYGGDSEDSGKD